MFNSATLWLGSKPHIPLAYFTLRCPWVYNDVTNNGNPRHDTGCVNGSGVSGPCSGAFYLAFLDENENVIAKLKNYKLYESDPTAMYSGTWGDFYEAPHFFESEPMVLMDSSSENSSIKTIRFGLVFYDWDGYTSVGKNFFETEDKIGNVYLSIEKTNGEILQLLRNSPMYCYLTGLYGLQMVDAYDSPKELSLSIPDTLGLCFKDIKAVNIRVTTGIISLRFPQ